MFGSYVPNSLRWLLILSLRTSYKKKNRRSSLVGTGVELKLEDRGFTTLLFKEKVEREREIALSDCTRPTKFLEMSRL